MLKQKLASSIIQLGVTPAGLVTAEAEENCTETARNLHFEEVPGENLLQES
ncbi:hypothetical protein [Halorussus litoreus]|uniref:hypothetical protein n=1 Tax=Halorussus litoreus TaxID=1710536 RepID=UPI0013006C18|nr:hypothetical protein [Halorussus litoreus]